MPRTCLDRLLSTLSVMFFPFGIMILVLFLNILLLPLIIILYIPWMIIDRHTPERGGRSWAWLRDGTFWCYIRDYFPYNLVKTTDLPADRHYIFCFHPHGAFSTGMLLNFATEATGFSKLFPGITPHALTMEGNYRFPLGREISLLLGTCSCSSKSIDYILSTPLTPAEGTANGTNAHRLSGSQAAVLAVGGIHEMLDAHPGSLRLTLLKRRGFARKALQHGADLVPVFSFGENDLMNQVNNPVGSRIRRIQIAMGDVAIGCGRWGLLIPFSRPVTTVVGSPLHVDRCENPTKEQVDELHRAYCQCLEEHFNKHKTNYGIAPESNLEFAGFD